ncbi:DUF2987 domain-containing protein [Rheinheimera salexigens]|uniref:DUF2987 domain-containing protein n=1 Tax=Rheinheimera salexigens TaxID=1628148 RepID=A0A1E7Q6J5_9GAMM|nr:DUF2987 domain-containing protein [Rheinheimera salexigens]OEY69766.1 hypothetical protein BI198_09460 [Rheinheimera salexigens]
MFKFFMLVLLFSVPAQATLMISYDSLYKKMKTLQKPEYSDLTLAFLLSNTQRNADCHYIDLRLTSDIHNMPLYLSANGEISLPFDEALKDSKARLILQQADNQARCELTLRLRSRMPLNATVKQQQLVHYQQQFSLVLADLAGSVSKRWLPEVQGVIIVFANNVTRLNSLSTDQQAVTKCQEQRCEIRLVDYNSALDLPWLLGEKPLYLLPLMAQKH